MAENGNASAIMKELLSNLFKYANPILNTALGFRAPGTGRQQGMYVAMDTQQ